MGHVGHRPRPASARPIRLASESIVSDFLASGVARSSLTSRNGVRAKLLIDNPAENQLPFILKTVDISPRLSDDLSDSSSIAERAPDPQAAISSTSHSKRGLQASHEDHRETNGSTRSTAKRTLPARDQSTPLTNQPGSSSNGQNPHKRVHVDSSQPLHHPDHHSDTHQTSTRPNSAASHPSNRSNPNNPANQSRPTPSQQASPLANPSRPALSQLPTNRPPASQSAVIPLKTLREIEQLQGGQKQSFNLIALIDDKKTEKCEQIGRAHV